ncbi:DUF2795 domain-containing protein [Bailinhaonella thermotolerans]|uniref:DUF2795 domain-containing protein n=1 Tax=Bailinhaonella thermotolerans TaxID=1070861 RepID=A0A3A4B075_9ACTN|nr:DUF2795 domain-containing protein [Bailinhaonella thermotolerans]RJL36057.1 DUF2795 domain-containing protein [Bailinhaonella thermotolerans]
MGDVPNPIQVQKSLSGVDYPVGKDRLVEHAKREGADQRVMDALRRLPDRVYNGPNAVSEEIGKLD